MIAAQVVGNSSTINGDFNDGESVYRPGASAGYTGCPASGETAAHTLFPKWHCIANVLLNDEPNEKCNSLMNRTQTQQQNFGATEQLSAQANTCPGLSAGYGVLDLGANCGQRRASGSVCK